MVQCVFATPRCLQQWLLTVLLLFIAWHPFRLSYASKTRKVHFTYPVEFLTPVIGSSFTKSVSTERLSCFGNRDYGVPTYSRTLLCMLPYMHRLGIDCNTLWGSRVVHVEVNGSVEFLKVPKLPRQANIAYNPISDLHSSSAAAASSRFTASGDVGDTTLHATRWLEITSPTPQRSIFSSSSSSLVVPLSQDTPLNDGNNRTRLEGSSSPTVSMAAAPVAIQDIRHIPAEPLFLCARSNNWRGDTAQFTISFRHAQPRTEDREIVTNYTILHLLLVLALSSLWVLPYVGAAVAAAVAYTHGMKIMLLLLAISTAVVGLTPIMLMKRNRHIARLYVNYFFGRGPFEEGRVQSWHESKQVVRERLPLFQAVFFSSVLLCSGFAFTYFLYTYVGIGREMRNTGLKITISLAVSWLVFFLCRSFERFGRDWMWVVVSIYLAHILDSHLNPLCRDKVMVAMLLISQALRILFPRVLHIFRVKYFVDTVLLPAANAVSEPCGFPLPTTLQQYERVHSFGGVITLWQMEAHSQRKLLDGHGLVSSTGSVATARTFQVASGAAGSDTLSMRPYLARGSDGSGKCWFGLFISTFKAALGVLSGNPSTTGVVHRNDVHGTCSTLSRTSRSNSKKRHRRRQCRQRRDAHSASPPDAQESPLKSQRAYGERQEVRGSRQPRASDMNDSEQSNWRSTGDRHCISSEDEEEEEESVVNVVDLLSASLQSVASEVVLLSEADQDGGQPALPSPPGSPAASSASASSPTTPRAPGIEPQLIPVSVIGPLSVGTNSPAQHYPNDARQNVGNDTRRQLHLPLLGPSSIGVSETCVEALQQACSAINAADDTINKISNSIGNNSDYQRCRQAVTTTLHPTIPGQTIMMFSAPVHIPCSTSSAFVCDWVTNSRIGAEAGTEAGTEAGAAKSLLERLQALVADLDRHEQRLLRHLLQVTAGDSFPLLVARSLPACSLTCFLIAPDLSPITNTTGAMTGATTGRAGTTTAVIQLRFLSPSCRADNVASYPQFSAPYLRATGRAALLSTLRHVKQHIPSASVDFFPLLSISPAPPSYSLFCCDGGGMDGRCLPRITTEVVMNLHSISPIAAQQPSLGPLDQNTIVNDCTRTSRVDEELLQQLLHVHHCFHDNCAPAITYIQCVLTAVLGASGAPFSAIKLVVQELALAGPNGIIRDVDVFVERVPAALPSYQDNSCGLSGITGIFGGACAAGGGGDDGGGGGGGRSMQDGQGHPQVNKTVEDILLLHVSVSAPVLLTCAELVDLTGKKKGKFSEQTTSRNPAVSASVAAAASTCLRLLTSSVKGSERRIESIAGQQEQHQKQQQQKQEQQQRKKKSKQKEEETEKMWLKRKEGLVDESESAGLEPTPPNAPTKEEQSPCVDPLAQSLGTAIAVAYSSYLLETVLEPGFQQAWQELRPF